MASLFSVAGLTVMEFVVAVAKVREVSVAVMVKVPAVVIWRELKLATPLVAASVGCARSEGPR